MTPGIRRSFALAAATVVLAALMVALLWLGSPERERMARLDARRVSELQVLARTIDVFWTRHARLPGSLQELVDQPGLAAATMDPETREPYEYRILERQYELCAQFAGDSRTGESVGPPGFWAHGPGRGCFVLTPERTTP